MSDLVKHVEKTQFNEAQTGQSTSKDTSTSSQHELGEQTNSSKRTAMTERALTGKTVTTNSNRERVNIGAQINFTVPIRITTPVAPGASC
jgi:hypothetical protein